MPLADLHHPGKIMAGVDTVSILILLGAISGGSQVSRSSQMELEGRELGKLVRPAEN